MVVTARCVLLGVLLAALVVGGCQTTYYAVWEKLGKEKRHLLKGGVEKARGDQQQAAEQFEEVLDRIKSLYGFEGGDLEKFYRKLRSDYDKCGDRAETVHRRIEGVETIAADLFAEWEREIEQIGNTDFRTKSAKALRTAKQRYGQFHDSITRAAAKMVPVLKSLHDYVLYLKHNLNAQAVGALKGEVDGIERQVKSLIEEMQGSIKEADAFLATFDPEGGPT